MMRRRSGRKAISVLPGSSARIERVPSTQGASAMLHA